MADYNVTSSDGTFIVNVQTGTINNQFDIPFIGQDAINYGDDLVAAQLRQLENFSSQSEPAFGPTKVKGQLWYDSTPSSGRLNLFDGSNFVPMPLDIDVVHNTTNEPVAGIKTFSSAPVFSAAGAPITVNSNTVVPNLNADFLDGQHATAFASTSQGILADGAEPALPLNTAGNGFVLTTDIAAPGNVYTWESPAVAAGTIQVDTGQLPTGGQIVFVDNADGSYGTGVQSPLTAAGITYNAATSTLTTTVFAGSFTGALTGNASTATLATTATTATNWTIADESSDTTCFPVFVTSATGNLDGNTGTNLSFNSSSGELTATGFTGSGANIGFLNLSTGTHTGTLATGRGGTGVTSATGTGTLFALNIAPVFTTEITSPRIASGSSVVLEWTNVDAMRTQEFEALGNTSSGQVRDHENNWLDVGYNTLPQFNFNTSDTLEAMHCGHVTGQTAGTETLTLEGSGTEDFPIGGVTTIINANSGDYTIVDGTATLRYLEPGVGLTDTVGGCTIGAGGVATIFRKAADEFYIWGSEITF